MEFNVEKLLLTEDVSQAWATLLSLTCHNYRQEREGRDSDKAPLATSTTTVESDCKIFLPLTVYKRHCHKGFILFLFFSVGAHEQADKWGTHVCDVLNNGLLNGKGKVKKSAST